MPTKEVARDRVLDDEDLARVILAARTIGGPYGCIVELLALTGQRREEVAQLSHREIDFVDRVWMIPKSRTKNGKAHVVHLSAQSMAVLDRAVGRGPLMFSLLGTKPFQELSRAKRLLDELSGVTGWRLHDCGGPASRAWPVWASQAPAAAAFTGRNTILVGYVLSFPKIISGHSDGVGRTIGLAATTPVRWTARPDGASLPNARCVRTSL